MTKTCVIVKQPPNLPANILGYPAIAEADEGDHVRVLVISPSGRCIGEGSVPRDCVAESSREHIVRPIEFYLRERARYAAELSAWRAAVAQAEQRTAERTGLTAEQVREVLRVFEEERPREG